MKLKNKILLIALGLVNLAIYLTLLIMVIPKNVPVLFDIYEKVVAVTSKWILMIFAILPLALAVMIIVFNKKTKLNFALKILYVLFLYENILFMAYYSLASSLAIGAVCEIPISLVIFLPLAVIFILLSIKLKNVPYLSSPAIRFKSTKETEFIWKQTHFYARDVYFVMSFILIIISIIFSFFKLCIVELGIFVLSIIVCTTIIYIYSNSLYKKYIEMKNRRDNLESQKLNKTENKTQENLKTEDKTSESKKQDENINNSVKPNKTKSKNK